MTLRRISESNPWRSLNYSRINDDNDNDDDDDDSEFSESPGIWEHNYNPSTSLWPGNPYEQPQELHKVSNLRTTCGPTSPPRQRYTTPPLSPDDKSSRHSTPLTRSPGPPLRSSHVSHHSHSPPPDGPDHYKRGVRYYSHYSQRDISPPPRHEDRALRGRDGNIETPHITAAKPPPSNTYTQHYSHPQEPPPFRVIRRPEQPQPRKLSHITLPPLSEFDRTASFNTAPPSAESSSSYGSTVPSRREDRYRNELPPPPPPMLSKTIQDLFRPMSRDLPRVMHMPFALQKPAGQDKSRELPSTSLRNIYDHSYTSRSSSIDDVPIPSSFNEGRSNTQKPSSSRVIQDSYIPERLPTPEDRNQAPEFHSTSNIVTSKIRTRGGREVRPAIRAPSVSSDSGSTSVPFEPDPDESSDDSYSDGETDARRPARRTTRNSRRKSAAAAEQSAMPAPMVVEARNTNDASRGDQGAASNANSPLQSIQQNQPPLKDNTLPILPPADGRRPKSHQTPWNTQGAPTFKVARQATAVQPSGPTPTGTAKDGLTWDFSKPDPYKTKRLPYSRNPASTQKKKAELRKNQEQSGQAAAAAAAAATEAEEDDEEIDELADDTDAAFVRQLLKNKPKTKKGTFKCPQCTILFTRNFDMSRHIKTVHETAPEEVLQSRTCPCCFTVPSRRDAFRRHLLRVPMSCNRLAQICGKPQPNIQGSQLETLYEMCRQMELRIPDVVRKHLGLKETD